jgi:diguanylate cyclase (GGDEF)-like protein
MTTRRVRPLVATLAILIAGASSARALDPQRAITQYVRDVFRVEQGLPQNSVQALLQTRDGFLWLGTQEGLVRFDGARFAVFDDATHKALREPNVIALAEDRDGTLWIGTAAGLVSLKDGVFAAYDADSGLPGKGVLSLFVDRQGRLWVGTDEGVARREGDAFVRPPGLNLRPYAVLAMAETEGALWFGTDSGLLRLTDAVEAFTKKDGLADNVVRALHVARDGRLWIGTDAGVDRFWGGRVYALAGPWPGKAPSVTSIREDAEGNVWIGTKGRGLLRLAGGRPSTFTQADGLSGDIVLATYEDREGSLWVGTDGDGLSRLRNAKLASFGRPEGLGHELLLPIVEDRHGALWLGSFGGGLHRYQDGRFQAYTEKNGLSSDFIASLLEDRRGSLWIGTDGQGLMQWQNGAVARRYREKDGLPSNRVVALHEDREGALWIGTYGGGLARLHDGRITAFGREQGLPSDFVLALAEDKAGRLWIGTESGGVSILEGGRFKTYTTEQGLSANEVLCLRADAEGTMWIGTAGGLTRHRDGRFASVTHADGLTDDRVFQILEDDAGGLWMSSNKGIFRVSKQEIEAFAEGRVPAVTSVPFGTGDGMRVAECNGKGQPAGARTRDGMLWFPTPRGLVRVDPRRIPRNELPPPVAVDELRVDHKSYGTASPVVPPGYGEVEIHYTGLSFLEPSKVRFRYRLVGFDRQWVDAGPRRVAYYTNIPPGTYRFEVAAANNDGVWNEEGASLAFELRPHFYQALWFHVLAVIGFLALAAYGYRWRIDQLAARERRLAVIVRERTRELEQANQMLARFSYLDAVTGIANRRNFDDGLDLEWRRLLREGGALSLVMIDIDHFKAFNDTYGHQKGDDCLKAVAQTLRHALHRPGDLCARFGGEEFGVILPGTEAEGALAVAEGLRRSVEDLAVPHSGAATAPVVTISAGVAALYPSRGGSIQFLVESADRALYQAKTLGRNRVVVASAAPLATSSLAGGPAADQALLTRPLRPS